MGKASSLDQRINPSLADQIFEPQRLQRSADEDWTTYKDWWVDESLPGDEIVERLALADDGRAAAGDEDFRGQRA
jgi:hypothetical protein